MSWSLKTLCHAITPDCPLIEAACTHVANEQWAWQMADKFGCMFVLAEASSAGGVRLSRHHVGFLAFIYPLFLFFRLPITEICRILNLTNVNSAKHAHVWSLHTCTSMGYTVILGISTLPVLLELKIWSKFIGLLLGSRFMRAISHQESLVCFLSMNTWLTNHHGRQIMLYLHTTPHFRHISQLLVYLHMHIEA